MGRRRRKKTRRKFSLQYRIYLKEAIEKGVTPLSEKFFLEAKNTLGTITSVVNKQIVNNNFSDYYLYQLEFEKVRKQGVKQTNILLPKTFNQYRKDFPGLTIKEIAEESIVESRKRAYKLVRMINKKKREDPEFAEELERLGLDKITQKDFMKQNEIIDAFWGYISSFGNGFSEVFYE